MNPKPSGRVFQFGLRRLLILTALIAVAWAVAAQWQVPCIVDERLSFQNVNGTITADTQYIMGTRRPTPGEIVKGGIAGSAVAVAMWCMCEAVIMWFKRGSVAQS